ncbi:MAG: Hsp20/alpha crystallin family protein [Deltaproteobacteria bacterium]|nr:Hsp20/alpha crystallin family protein [Deltaproteobacteria bacterium]
MSRKYIPEFEFSAQFSRFADRLSRYGRSEGSEGWTPAMDIYETADAVVIVAEVAGVGAQQVKVIVDGDVVRIYGQRPPICREPGAIYHRMEIETGAFVRSFRISVPVEADKARANSADGLLYVVLPRRKAPQETKIEVQPA